MECVGARNVATMAVSSCSVWRTTATRRRWRLSMKQSQQPGFRSHQPMRVRVRARARARARGSGGSGRESCVVVKEDYVNEEDVTKAGGSELLFVQMQQKKIMDKQSRIADKLPSISVGEDIFDLVVIGCGPAGLSLASEAAKLGLKVGLIGPDLPFTNNYGVWEDEFKDLGLGGCIEHVWQDTIVYLDSDDPITIGRAYGRVSRHLLHEELLRRCFHLTWIARQMCISYMDSLILKYNKLGAERWTLVVLVDRSYAGVHTSLFNPKSLILMRRPLFFFPVNFSMPPITLET